MTPPRPDRAIVRPAKLLDGTSCNFCTRPSGGLFVVESHDEHCNTTVRMCGECAREVVAGVRDAR